MNTKKPVDSLVQLTTREKKLGVVIPEKKEESLKDKQKDGNLEFLPHGGQYFVSENQPENQNDLSSHHDFS
jgi:hypothetical protein